MADKGDGDHLYDVAIVGSGVAGSILAACLARNGADVVLIDADTHPKFTIGESTIPFTSMMMRLVAERYGVPEIKHLSTFEGVYANITTQCGVKRNFGFLYHREGKRQLPGERTHFQIPKVLNTENHYFRQDIDSWMLTVAVKYGTHVRQQQPVVDVDLGSDEVTLKLATGASVRAKFIVDASGYRSVLARKLSLREEPTRFKHHSRTLFNHFTGVRPFDDVGLPDSGFPTKWHEGTLHHLFRGGWMWIIPFDNHPRATNPLCSVGIQLDPRLHPEPDCSAEEEFRRFLARFPDVAAQFTGARPVRSWVRTGRLQYSPRQTVGHRWCLTSHAAGFIDPLFSRGMSNTMETVHALTHRLLDAIRDNDFSVERFAHMQELEQGLLDFNDDLCANAYTSFGDWRLWNAWFRIWALGQIMATFEVNRTYARFLATRDTAALEPLEHAWWRGKAIPEESPYAPVLELLREVSEACQAVQRKELDAGAAANAIHERLRKADFIPPAFGLADPDRQCIDASVLGILNTLRWAKRKAPPEIGKLTHEGLTLFMKKRVGKGEFEISEEFKHLVAGWPMVGRSLRVPAPTKY
ncbi:tryptophan 7-halogenase [Streptomyces sp. NA02950]|uniref:NAD(P)/FAD-dependent oxidoreductase n=1 Tax=Streptomyces sp. NA02950 TaxID=2742137 RepID=UPI0015902291|nr:tryptophan 7-halogenase [Streptomyces sp. NA02950]QKV90518.1 tryptophan 7-halogenase [Streptomyces sp. NA02950]